MLKGVGFQAIVDLEQLSLILIQAWTNISFSLYFLCMQGVNVIKAKSRIFGHHFFLQGIREVKIICGVKTAAITMITD